VRLLKSWNFAAICAPLSQFAPAISIRPLDKGPARSVQACCSGWKFNNYNSKW